MTLSVAIIMIALTVTEIALCARKTLDPVTMLLLVTAKTGVMGMHMIQLVGMYAVKPTFDSLVWNFPVTVVLLGTMVAQLVVSRRVYGRGIQQQQQQGAGATSVSAIEDEEALKTDASPPKYTF